LLLKAAELGLFRLEEKALKKRKQIEKREGGKKENWP